MYGISSRNVDRDHLIAYEASLATAEQCAALLTLPDVRHNGKAAIQAVQLTKTCMARLLHLRPQYTIANLEEVIQETLSHAKSPHHDVPQTSSRLNSSHKTVSHSRESTSHGGTADSEMLIMPLASASNESLTSPWASAAESLRHPYMRRYTAEYIYSLCLAEVSLLLEAQGFHKLAVAALQAVIDCNVTRANRGKVYLRLAIDYRLHLHKPLISLDWCCRALSERKHNFRIIRSAAK